MPVLFHLLDMAAIVSARLASWLWYRAGIRTLRRLSRFERLDAPGCGPGLARLRGKPDPLPRAPLQQGSVP